MVALIWTSQITAPVFDPKDKLQQCQLVLLERTTHGTTKKETGISGEYTITCLHIIITTY
jgi:hypothetical protein